MQIKHTFIGPLVAATAGLSPNLQAKEVTWDTHDAIEVGVGVANPGAIDDTYVFTLIDPAVLYASAVANNLNSTFDVTDGKVSLMREGGNGAADQLIADFAFDGTSGDLTKNFGQLAAGDYFYRISGAAAGRTGGVYSITSEVVPVPEPATAAMASAAALLLLALGSRRNRD